MSSNPLIKVSTDTSSAQDLREIMLSWGISRQHSPRQPLDHISLAGSSILDPSMESLVFPLAREGVSFLMHAEYADLDICSVVSHANGKWSDGVEAFRLL
jgi:hypothetical protein